MCLGRGEMLETAGTLSHDSFCRMAAGSVPEEKWWRRRESNPRPKVRRRRTLHACPLRDFHARRVETAKYHQALASETSRGHAPRRRVATSLLDGVRPSTTRRGQGERHCLIKQRERTENPQLTDVPSDLRVNGARHASRDLALPSKPNSPPRQLRAGRSSGVLSYCTR